MHKETLCIQTNAFFWNHGSCRTKSLDLYSLKDLQFNHNQKRLESASLPWARPLIIFFSQGLMHIPVLPLFASTPPVRKVDNSFGQIDPTNRIDADYDDGGFRSRNFPISFSTWLAPLEISRFLEILSRCILRWYSREWKPKLCFLRTGGQIEDRPSLPRCDSIRRQGVKEYDSAF